MDFFDNSYHRLNKRLLSFIGHWPHQSTRKKLCYRALTASWIMTILVPEIIKLVDVWGSDVDTVFECVPSLGLHVINFIKWVSCIVNGDKLKKLLVFIELDWKSRENGNGSDVLRKYAERARVITLGYTCYMFVTASLNVSLPLITILHNVFAPLNESRPFPALFRTEYFVDEEKFFFPIYLHGVLTTFTSMTIVVAIDTMYGVYTQYACSKFAELGDVYRIELEQIEISDDESIYVSENLDSTYRRIVECVKKHKEAIEFVDLMESTYTAYFFFVTGVNIVLMSLTGAQAVLIEDTKLAIRYSFFTLGQIAHVFFGCWHGQLLIDHSASVNKATYNSKWYKSSFRTRRLVMLIMLKSIDPCRLSAGKLFFISLENFSRIIKAAMSYFTVLTSLR